MGSAQLAMGSARMCNHGTKLLMLGVGDLCRKIPNGVNGIEERLHVVWQEMVVSGVSVAAHTKLYCS